MSLFQSNLRKQIRNLPKILNFVKKIHYYCELFTSLLTPPPRRARAQSKREKKQVPLSGRQEGLFLLRTALSRSLRSISISSRCRAIWGHRFLAKFRQNVARFRLYRHRSLQLNTRFAAFFKIYQIIKLNFLKFGKILQILRHLQNFC